jgi:GrpB-like predicted nucleotidyltransferase (UPF0157 family)
MCGDRVDREFATARFRTMTNRVNIVPYDPDWPRRFHEERRILATAFAGSDAVIEHVGSTAVPGLGAKPVIDVLIGLPMLAEVERRIPVLEAAGYEYAQKYERQLPDRRYFRKPRLGPRAFHLHCVVTGGDFWIRHLAFRDYLRAHPESAAAYYHLKRDLALRVSKEEYTEAKTPFIDGILASAMCLPDDSVIRY